MEGNPLRVVIRYVPVLEKICKLLGLQAPVYNCLDLSKNVAYVLVPTNSGPSAYTYDGNEGKSIEESCQSAAKKMVKFLVRTFNVKVDDVNLGARLKAENCSYLFKLMRDRYDRMEKNLPTTGAPDSVVTAGLQLSEPHVSIDFLDVLKQTVPLVGIPVTPVEVLKTEDSMFIAWFTFEVPSHVFLTESVIGEKCDSVHAAKESVAKKGLSLMMPLYRFHVEDVNFHFLNSTTYAFKLEKESYMAIRERVCGVSHPHDPHPVIVEQDQLTPRGERNRIAIPSIAPLPPKKRKATKRPNSFSDVAAKSVVPEELTSVFKRKKQE